MTRLPDLDTLRLLVSVAETGSLGQAAARQGISQPSASTRIRTLERGLGVPLLVRTTSGSRLTPAGLLITEWSRSVLERAYALLDGTAALRARQSTRLRIAASLTVAEHLVPGWLIALRRAEPELQVELTVANSAQVVTLLRAGSADLGFVECQSVPADLHGHPVGQDRLTVVVLPGHPWTRRRKPVPTAELATTPLLLREHGSGTRETFDAALTTPALPALELGSTAALRAAALAGAAPAVLSALAVTDDLAAGRLSEVRTDLDLRRTLHAVWPLGTSPQPLAQRLLALSSRR